MKNSSINFGTFIFVLTDSGLEQRNLIIKINSFPFINRELFFKTRIHIHPKVFAESSFQKMEALLADPLHKKSIEPLERFELIELFQDYLEIHQSTLKLFSLALMDEYSFDSTGINELELVFRREIYPKTHLYFDIEKKAQGMKKVLKRYFLEPIFSQCKINEKILQKLQSELNLLWKIDVEFLKIFRQKKIQLLLEPH